MNQFLFSLIFLFGCSLSAPVQTIPYTGFRFSMHKSLVNTNYIQAFQNAMSSLKNTNFTDISIEFNPGNFFSSGLYITKPTCTDAGYTASSPLNIDISSNTISLNQQGTMFSYSLGFQWNFKLLGMTLMGGNGKATFVSSQFSAKQVFTPEQIVTNASANWNCNVQVSSDLFGLFSNALANLLAQKHTQDFNDHYLSYAISLATYYKLSDWLDIHEHFDKNGTLDMDISNYIYYLNESPANFISIGMFTAVAVEDRPYFKMIWREHDLPVVMGNATFQVCMAAGVIPAMVEVQGKARDFIRRVPPKSIGLTGKVKDLFSIMPDLAQTIDPNLDMYIGCLPDGNTDFLMIKDEKMSPTVTRMQMTVNCSFGALKQGKNLLTASFAIRASIIRNPSVTGNVMNITGTLTEPQVYFYRTPISAAPIASLYPLYGIINNIVGLLDGMTLIPQGISVSMPFKANGASINSTAGETCFSFW